MAGKREIIGIGLAILLAACSGPSPEGVVRADVSRKGPVCTYGIRIVPEEVPGNLSAELVQNQWFEEGLTGWEVLGEGVQTAFTTDCPLLPSSPTALAITVPEGGHATLRCLGYDGMDIRDKAYYYLRLNTAWGHRFDGMLNIRLVAGDGRVLCDRPLRPDRDSLWCEYTGQLTAEGTAPDAVLEIGLDGTGTLLFDYVSLMPFAAFHRRIYGMRADVGEALEALHPAFVRWDGGNGWEFTCGDPKGRVLFGIQEFLELSEDLGATAHLAFKGCPAEFELKNAAEYAWGDGNTRWSRERTVSQQEPYPLTLLEADEPYEADIPYDLPFSGMRTAIVPVVDALTDAAALTALEALDTLAVPATLLGREGPALIHTTAASVETTPSYSVWQLFQAHRPSESFPVCTEVTDCTFSAGYDAESKAYLLKIVNPRDKAATFTYALDGTAELSGKGSTQVLDARSGRIREGRLSIDGPVFNYTAPAHSVNFLNLSEK